MGILSQVKWLSVIGAAAVVTVGGTYLAVNQSQTAVEQALSSATLQDLQQFNLNWAEVDVRGREVVVSGTTANPKDIERAENVLSQNALLHSYKTDISVATPMEPYRLHLSKNEGARKMVGGVPNEQLGDELIALFGDGETELTLASGGPDAKDWRDAAEFGIRLLQHFDQGKVTIEGLEVSFAGRAKDQNALHTLDVVFEAGFPDNLSPGSGETIPPFLEEYEFGGNKQPGAQAVFTGYVPNKTVKASLAEIGDVENLLLASGESENFVQSAELLATQLQQLERGVFTLENGVLSFEGEPKDFAAFDGVKSAIAELPSEIDSKINILPPVVSPFDLNLQSTDGVMAATGVVPDEAALKRVADATNGDVSNVRIARGAPDNFGEATNFLLNASQLMESGASLQISDQKLEVAGVASAPTKFLELEKLLDSGPQGFSVTNNVQMPTVSPYKWSVNKSENGRVLLAGYSPSRDLMAEILTMINAENKADETLPALGEPAGFKDIVVASANATNHMVTGSVGLENDSWKLDAVVKDKAHETNLLNEFVNKQIQPEILSAQFTRLPPPVVENYVFTVSKDDAGLSFDGYVPTEELQLLFTALGKSDLRLGSGVSEEFADQANQAIAIVQEMESGSASFENGMWRFTGTVEMQSEKEALLSQIFDAFGEENAQSEIEARVVPIVPYRFAAEKAQDGTLAATGYVPNEDVLGRLKSTISDEALLNIGVGAPDEFEARAQAGIEALKLLDTGRVSLIADTWTVIGRASSPEKLEQLTTVLAEHSSVFRIDVQLLEPVTALAFSATVTNSIFDRGGYLADPDYWQVGADGAVEYVGPEVADRNAFHEDILLSVAALKLLENAELSYEGGNWKLKGDAPSTEALNATNALIVETGIENWQVELVDLEAEANAEAEEKARQEAEAKAKAEAEEKARLEAEAKAKGRS